MDKIHLPTNKRREAFKRVIAEAEKRKCFTPNPEWRGAFEKPEDYAVWLCDTGHEYQTIFSHSFAKAFFGEGKKCSCGGTGSISGIITFHDASCEIDNDWKWHLQQMVISEDPIYYLEDFITHG